MNYLTETLQPYTEYLPYFIVATITTFLLTPFFGLLAGKFQILDLSALKARTDERGLLKKINREVALRAGGVAIVIPFIIIALLTQTIDKQLVAITISLSVLLVGGIIDDKYRTGKIPQLIPQIIAAVIIIASGISIDSIQNPFGEAISLRLLVFPFNLFQHAYSFAFPADILTFVWILLMIHAVNWIFGVNALGEGVSLIAFITILLVSVKLGNFQTAFLASVIAGSILGFIPFTAYPAKIISGTTGSNAFGFLIAVLSIMGGVKVSAAVIVLIVPLLDMLWVMIGRINRNGAASIKEALKAVTTSDHSHLHHRLLKLGFSPPQVALIECIAVCLCAVIAFYSANLPKVTSISIVSVFVLIFFFTISSLLKRKVTVSQQEQVNKKQGKKPPEETPESKYAY